MMDTRTISMGHAGVLNESRRRVLSVGARRANDSQTAQCEACAKTEEHVRTASHAGTNRDQARAWTAKLALITEVMAHPGSSRRRTAINEQRHG